jgi:hypothetical protein
VERMRDKIDACGVLVRRLEGKRPFGRLTHRWEIDIKTYVLLTVHRSIST